MRVNISERTAERVAPLFVLEPHGSIAVKGKGALRMSFLDPIRPEFSADPEGVLSQRHVPRRGAGPHVHSESG
jgi:hypothetical protein